MEAVARQFVNNNKCLIIRNGWFSYRWTQIIDAGQLTDETIVLKAQQSQPGTQEAFAPAAIDDVVKTILGEKPAVVFAPHVETSSGMILPDDYLKAVSDAVHQVGGIFVLDCIASGTIWVDMQKCGIDILISAPQKGWSGSPCCALVMMNQATTEAIDSTTSSSFSCDLKKWMQIMQAYDNGGHAYHATMPTDSLTRFRDIMNETVAYGLEKVRDEQQALGDAVRALLKERGIKSVAAEGFGAPGVVVSYTQDDGMHTGKSFAAQGLQIAAGVPLMCDEPEDYKTFRIGLFGLEKLHNLDRTVANFDQALSSILK